MNIYHVCLGFIGHLDLIEPFILERIPANDVHSPRDFLQAAAQWLLRIRQTSGNDQQDLKVTFIYRVENRWRASAPARPQLKYETADVI